MKRKIRNITITLDERVARWVRVEAAKNDLSISGFLARVLHNGMEANDDYEAAMQRALSMKPFLRTDGRYLTRDEIHERDRLR